MKLGLESGLGSDLLGDLLHGLPERHGFQYLDADVILLKLKV